MQLITRITEFDYGHRVLNEKMKCHNLHGHRAKVELIFKFQSLQEIGYQIDFKEIKRIGCQWIDDNMDHAYISNPKDIILINSCKKINSKIWIMSLNGKKYCNPTAENISKEIFLAIQILFEDFNLTLNQIRFYETPNCFIDTFENSVSEKEKQNFYKENINELRIYKKQKGTIEYDDRRNE